MSAIYILKKGMDIPLYTADHFYESHITKKVSVVIKVMN